MKRNYFWLGREWPYKDVKPRIIAEKYMEDESKRELKDYKIFCFEGTPQFIQVDYNRFTNHKRNLYSINWDFIETEYVYPSDKSHTIEKPLNLEEMLQMSRILSADFHFMRTDFYYINEKIFFGELTFYPEAGFGHFENIDFDRKLGEYINLDQ